MAKVYFSLGSNQGDRINFLAKAVHMIAKQIGKIECLSDVIESEPWGFETDTAFYNMALAVETGLEPHQVLEAILGIEECLGRVRTGNGYSNRPIDIDILFYDGIHLVSDQLVVPHPLLHQRNFVLFPLNDIAPHFLHPVFNKTVNNLFLDADDSSRIELAMQKEAFEQLLKTITMI